MVLCGGFSAEVRAKKMRQDGCAEFISDSLTETNAKWTFFVILFYYLRCTTFSDDLPTKALGIVPHDVKELPRQCIVKYLTIVVISLMNMVGI